MNTNTSLANAENTFVGNESVLAVKNFVENEADESIDILNFVARTFRGRWRNLLLSCLPLTIVFATIGYLWKDPVFESVGLLRVAANKPSILYEDQNSSNAKHYDSFVEAQLSILISYPVRTRALTLLESEGVMLDRSDDFDQLVTVKRRKSLLMLSSRHSDPATAQHVLNALIDSYLTDKYERLNSRRSFRETELITREQELLEQIKSVVDEMLVIGEEYGLESIVQAHLAKIRELEKLEGKLSEIENTILELETVGTVVNMDHVETEMKRALVLDHALAEMIYDQAKRRAKLVTLKQRYQPNHRLVESTEAELRVMDNAIESRSEQISTLGKTGLRNSNGEKSLQEMNGLRDQLSNRRNDLQASAKLLNEKLVKLEFLDGEREALRVLLDETRRILDEVRIESRDSLPGMVEIVSRGITSEKPIRDKRPALSALMGAGGFGLSLTLLLGVLILQGRFRYSDDLRSITRDSEILAHFNKDEEVRSSNQADKLRNSIQLLELEPRNQTNGGRIIAISGACQNSKASEIAEALGISFGNCKMKTLVIDANLSSGALTYSLSMDGKKGWRDILANGDTSSIYSLENFSFVPIGEITGLQDREISIQRIRDTLTELASEFDVIIVDLGTSQTLLSAKFVQSLSDLNLFAVTPGESLGKIRKLAADIHHTMPGRLRLVISGVFDNDPITALEPQ
jgi:uncharacterized protein involved in exopolysaccharide biosynthesis